MPDIDLDFANRTAILDKIKHVPAAIINDTEIRKHNTGVYCHNIPVNPFNKLASIDYRQAEDRGYFKIDFLNVNLYNQIENNQQLLDLMNREPQWDQLYEQSFCEQLIHIGNHYDTLISMPEAVTSIDRMAMFLAIIRPAKRHLIGKPWDEVAKTVWIKPDDDGYYFKKSHSLAYSHLVVVNMNLLNLSDLTN